MKVIKNEKHLLLNYIAGFFTYIKFENLEYQDDNSLFICNMG